MWSREGVSSAAEIIAENSRLHVARFRDFGNLLTDLPFNKQFNTMAQIKNLPQNLNEIE